MYNVCRSSLGVVVGDLPVIPGRPIHISQFIIVSVVVVLTCRSVQDGYREGLEC